MSYSKYNMVTGSSSLETAEFEDLIIPKINAMGIQPKFQTKICDHWRRFGVCSYGESCWYAHGESDLRKLSLKAEKFDDKMSELNAKEPKSAPPKRASTNVKGLTVSIPSNSFKESNSSLPLSPAQERWVSMSGQSLKSTDPFEPEHDKKMMLENVVAEKRYGRGGGEEENEFDELAGFLTSPNPYHYQPPLANRMAHGAPRSFSRGARMTSAQYAAQPQYPAAAPARFPPSHRSSSALRSSREPSFHSWIEPEPKNDEQQFLAELAKAKDLAHMRFMMEHGLISERPNDLMSNPPSFNPAPKTGSDCHGCGGTTTRGKEHVSLYSSFIQRPQQRVSSSHHHHHHQHHAQHFAPPPFRAHSHPAPPTELAAPPKMLESLLPSDDAFSIWFDSTSSRAPPATATLSAQFTESSESSASLLTKMEALRTEKCPITEEEMSSAGGKSPVNGNLSSIESLSPLMDMMGSTESSRMTMFDFDSLKIAETLRMTPATSRHTSARIESPFFFFEEKTPGFVESPSFLLEPCDFFAAGGSCPFGDGCHLSHSIRNEHNN